MSSDADTEERTDELVTQLLWEAVIPKREQEQDRQTRQANMEQELDK